MLTYKHRMKSIYLFGIIFLLNSVSFGQTTEREKLSPWLKDLQENIILHTDRTLYVSGENMWFNAEYMVNGQKSETKISNVLYVELFNPKLEPVVQKKFKIQDHSVKGMLEIPEGVPTGEFILRAYTKYQRNFSHYDYTHQRVIVFNPEVSPNNELKKAEPEIRIFPSEKGLSKKASKDYPFFINLPGKFDSLHLVNSEDSALMRLSVPVNGFGMIKGHQSDSADYSVKAYLKKGGSIIKKLPEPQKDEVRISTRFVDGALHYHMAGLKKDSSYQLEIYSQSLLKKAGRKAGADSPEGKIQAKNLESGLNFLVIRNSESDSTIKMKTVYKFHKSSVQPDIRLDKKTYAPREEVTLNFALPNSGSVTDLSVAVFRKGTGNSHRMAIPQHVLTNPWLLSGLVRGKENPDKFRDQIEAALLAFDQRVGANIIRQINQVDGKLKHLPEVRDVTVSGLVRNKKTGKPVEKQQVYGSVLFNNPQFHIYETNADGEFVFSLNDLKGLQDIFLCPVQRSEKAQEYEILINHDFDPRVPEFINTPFPLDETDRGFLEEIKINYQLNLAFNERGVKEKKPEKQRRFYYLFGKERISRILDNYVELDEMWDVLYEIVPHVKPVRKKGSYELKIMNDNSWVLPGKPLILLDNVPIFDVNKIMELHPSQVEKIEVIDRTYLLGSHAINGVILITTKTDNFGGVKFPEASVFAEYMTIADDSEYTEVRYDSKSQKESEAPDFRNLLYWQPEIKIADKAGRFSFYTSDRRGRYHVVVRGTDAEGHSVYAEKTILVQ